MTAALDAAREALRETPAWLVGGAVRDRLLGRAVSDLDVAVHGDPKRLARHLAVGVGGPVFALGDAWGAWRVMAPDRSWQIDVVALRGDGIEDDLRLRDFTVNAIAEPLDGGSLVDPYGGADDLAARRLRMVGPASFREDPLRTLRLARFACELGLEPERATLEAARAEAPGLARVAAERIFAELRRVVVAPAALDGFDLMRRTGVTAVVLPELEAMREVGQNPYHHLDVHDHTLAVLQAVIDLEEDPAHVVGPEHAEAVAAHLAEPFADELTRGGALRFGALLHDIAKPPTRRILEDGRVSFMGHDGVGADMARDILTRLRASERLRAHVAALTRHHLLLGFLVHRRPLDRRTVHDYLAACDPVEVDVTLLSVCDRLATRGRKSREAIAAHCELAREILPDALAWARRDRRPLVRGDELARALGLAPGPELGRLVGEIAAARWTGEVATPEEAIALARRLHAAHDG